MRQNIIIIWVRLPKLENIYLHSNMQKHKQTLDYIYVYIRKWHELFVSILYALTIIVDNFDINMMK